MYRKDIQGLRAIAVITVMAFHFNPALLPGGFIGVDVFLVISGFLITRILLSHKGRKDYSLKKTLQYFYISRLKRIVPAYFAMLVVVALVAAVLFLPQDFMTFKQGLGEAVWFNSNSYFAGFGDYFFPASNEQPLLHTWSLAVEIQFYLLAPFLVLMMPIHWFKWVLISFLVLLTALAEYRLRVMGLEQNTYYSLYARLPAFFAGSLAALLSNTKSGIENAKRPSELGLLFIFIAAVTQPLLGPFPGVAALLPVLGGALLLCQPAQGLVGRFLVSRAMVWIGTLSYSLYLWHWPVLAFMRYYTGTEILDWQFSFAFIGSTLALAIASYYWIETPLRQKRSKKQVAGYACLVLLTLGAGGGMQKVNAYFTPEPLPIEYTRSADPERTCHGEIIGDCLWGKSNSNKEILVIGDSHANMLSHFFETLGQELNFKAKIISGSSSVTIPDFDYQRISEWAQKACLAQIEHSSRLIGNYKNIFLAASWNYHLESNNFKEALDSFLKLHNSKSIYIIGQEPLLTNSPVRSIRFNFIGLPSLVQINNSYLDTNKILVNMANDHENVTYLDFSMLPIFQSVPVYEGMVIYRDYHHIHSVAAEEYGRQAKEQFKKILND